VIAFETVAKIDRGGFPSAKFFAQEFSEPLESISLKL